MHTRKQKERRPFLIRGWKTKIPSLHDFCYVLLHIAPVRYGRKVDYVRLALLFMIPSPCIALACLLVFRAQSWMSIQKSKIHTLEQDLTTLQEAQVRSLTGALKGSFEPVQAKQLSHASMSDLLRWYQLHGMVDITDWILTRRKQLACLHEIFPFQLESLCERRVRSRLAALWS